MMGYQDHSMDKDNLYNKQYRENLLGRLQARKQKIPENNKYW